jgi:hypothetical protein
MLNPIDFVDLYRRKLAERQAGGGTSESLLPN